MHKLALIMNMRKGVSGGGWGFHGDNVFNFLRPFVVLLPLNSHHSSVTEKQESSVITLSYLAIGLSVWLKIVANCEPKKFILGN